MPNLLRADCFLLDFTAGFPMWLDRITDLPIGAFTVESLILPRAVVHLEIIGTTSRAFVTVIAVWIVLATVRFELVEVVEDLELSH